MTGGGDSIHRFVTRYRCWLGGTHGRVVARSGAAVNIFSVGTPIKLGVINPWQSISKGFALLVGNCSLDTVIVE